MILFRQFVILDWLFYRQFDRFFIGFTQAEVEVEDLVKEEHSKHNHNEATKLSVGECFVTNPCISQEEDPNDYDSHLVHNDAVSGREELCHIDCKAIKHRRCEQEAEAVYHYNWTSPGLLRRQKDVINMTVNTLCFIKWTRHHLPWYQDQHSENDAENTFPSHHIERLLSGCPRQNMLLEDCVGSVEELTAQ